MSFYDYTGKRIYTGLESSGKSLMLSAHLVRNVKRNAAWKTRLGIDRPIVTTLPVSDSFITYAKSVGVRIEAIHEVSEFPRLRGCDFYIDEIGTYFPKDMYEWKDVPQSVKRWLPQSEKLGVHIYGTAQDYGQVNKDFRRLVKALYEVKQAFGPKRPGENLPNNKQLIFGLLVIHKLDARRFDGDQFDMKTIGWFPKLKFYNHWATDRYDTNKMVIESPPAPLRKITRICPEDGKTITRYV